MLKEVTNKKFESKINFYYF